VDFAQFLELFSLERVEGRRVEEDFCRLGHHPAQGSLSKRELGPRVQSTWSCDRVSSRPKTRLKRCRKRDKMECTGQAVTRMTAPPRRLPV
jgi:hypothetical protein